MGFWNDGFRGPRSPSPRRSSSNNNQQGYGQTSSSSRPANRSTTSSNNNNGGPYYSSRPTNRSVSSFFSSAGSTSRGYGSSSRARPRSGLVAKMRRFLRKLYDYMRRHPVKVFMLVLMPLLTGGALTKILSRLGVRMPAGIESMFGGAGARGMGGGGGIGADGRYYSRGGARDFGGGSSLPGMGGGVGDSVQGIMKLAGMFM